MVPARGIHGTKTNRRHLQQRDFVRRAEPHGRTPRAGAGGDVEHRLTGIVAAEDAGKLTLDEPVEGHDLSVVGMSTEHQVDAEPGRILETAGPVIHEDREPRTVALRGSHPIEHLPDLVPRLGVVDADDVQGLPRGELVAQHGHAQRCEPRADRVASHVAFVVADG